MQVFLEVMHQRLDRHLSFSLLTFHPHCQPIYNFPQANNLCRSIENLEADHSEVSYIIVAGICVTTLSTWLLTYTTSHLGITPASNYMRPILEFR